jgi:hypothetical protein
VPSYVVEAYVPARGGSEVADAARRAGDAALALTTEGRPIRFVRSTFLPTDEVCLLVFEADSAALVGEATERAAIAFERIIEAVE